MYYKTSNGGKTVIDLGVGTSFNVSNRISNYKSLSASNFICELSSSFSGDGRSASGTGAPYQDWVSTSFSVSLSKSYNANTGVFTVSYNGSSTGSKYGLSAYASKSQSAHVYLVI
jgi:hypothetical protein